MAVIAVIGATKSGKSKLVETKIIPLYKRALVFDVVNCFRSLPVRISMDSKYGLENVALDKAYEIALRNPDFFKIALVPGENTDYRKAFDKVVTSACFMGKAFASVDDPLLVVCDEAGILCSNKFQSAKIQKITARGRHWHIDSVFIAQRPQMLHGDIKDNATIVHIFRLTTAFQNEFIVGLVGKDIAKEIKSLPQYHYVTWYDTDLITFTDENGRIYKKIGG